MDDKFNIINIDQLLDEITNVKIQLKSRIQEKGVTVDVGLNDYGDKIREIEHDPSIWIWDGTTEFAHSTYVPAISFMDVTRTGASASPFTWCKAEELRIYDTSHLTNTNFMFYGCESLTTIPQLDTSNVTDMGDMFYRCTSLTTIPLLDTSNVIHMSSLYGMFYGCGNLQHLGGFKNLGVGLNLSYCPLLTHESLMNVINNLAEVATSPKLTLGVTNLAKLTDDEIAIATDKGWIVN